MTTVKTSILESVLQAVLPESLKLKYDWMVSLPETMVEPLKVTPVKSMASLSIVFAGIVSGYVATKAAYRVLNFIGYSIGSSMSTSDETRITRRVAMSFKLPELECQRKLYEGGVSGWFQNQETKKVEVLTLSLKKSYKEMLPAHVVSVHREGGSEDTWSFDDLIHVFQTSHPTWRYFAASPTYIRMVNTKVSLFGS